MVSDLHSETKGSRFESGCYLCAEVLVKDNPDRKKMADNKNEMIHLKNIVVNAIDAITILGEVNHQITFERKEKF